MSNSDTRAGHGDESVYREDDVKMCHDCGWSSDDSPAEMDGIHPTCPDCGGYAYGY